MKLMEEVFQCNIDKFAKGNELYVLKEIFLASLIMHHLQLRKDCGTANVVSSMLLDKAVDVGITCLESPSLAAHLILKRWSEAIRKDFEHKLNVAHVSVMDAPGKEVHSLVTLLVDRMEAQSKSYAESLAVVIKSNEMLHTALDNMTRIVDIALLVSLTAWRNNMLRTSHLYVIYPIKIKNFDSNLVPILQISY